MSPAPLYYEDLSIGRRFTTGTMEVNADEMVKFAAEYDPQPFHLDEAAGQASVFGGLVASGWMTGLLTMRLMLNGELKLAGGMIGLGVEALLWPRPVRPGDRITAATEVVEMRPSASKPAYGVVKFRTTTTNQKAETVQIFEVNQLVLRRPTNAV